MTDAIRPATTPGDPWARNIWALTLIVFVAVPVLLGLALLRKL